MPMLGAVLASILPCKAFSASGLYIPDPSWNPIIPSSIHPGKVSAVAVDRQSNVFIGQRGLDNKIMRFTNNGTYLKSFGDEIKTVHGMKIQTGKGSEHDYLWVTDTGSHDVKKYDSVTGNLLLTLGTTGHSGNGTDPIQFGSVADISFDNNGSIYISDGDGGENHRVVKLSGENGNKVQWIAGNNGAVSAQFSSPHSLAYQTSGDRIWIANRNFFRVDAIDATTGVNQSDSSIAQECFPGASVDNATPWSVRVDDTRDILYVAVAHSALKGYTPAQAQIVAFDISKRNNAAKYASSCPKLLATFDVGDVPKPGAAFQWTLHELANDAHCGTVYGATVDAPSWQQGTVRFITNLETGN
jgi:hypothetical protein